MLSVQPEITFAEVSSSALRTSDGTSTACAGLVIVVALAVTAPSA